MATALQVFNDPVHGSIQLHPLLVKIIDTPQFQRLRDIKQLGVCYWVYPVASHNRFEHSIGVSYLCGQMIDTLQALHPDLVTRHESLCIKIAGLCRDLGYGPFSHFFHEVLIPKLPSKAMSEDLAATWTQDASCKMFDFMLQENEDLTNAFKDNEDLEEDEYQDFIKDLICGKAKSKEKAFLYEIVSNLRNRIDCNKFDYIARDCHYVGFKSGFIWQRFLQNICIRKEPNGKLQIRVRDKEALNLYQLFHARWMLYHQVYRHKTIPCIEDILASAFLKAEFKLQISKLLTDDGLLSEAGEAMKRYTKLTDRIFYDILDLGEEPSASIVESDDSKKSEETGKKFSEAKNLLLNIQRRKLYKYCGYAELEDPDHKYPCKKENEEENKEEHKCPSKEVIAEEIAQASNGKVSQEEIFVSIAYFHYGKEGDNPIQNVGFCNKSQGSLVDTEHASYMLPKTFHERFIRVYAKANRKIVQDSFKKWCIDHGKELRRRVIYNDKSDGIQPEDQ